MKHWDSIGTRQHDMCMSGDVESDLAIVTAELSYAEIGEALGLAEKTVKSRLHEARQRLGRVLQPQDGL